MDSPYPLWLCALLYPAGLLYRGGVGLRNLLYEGAGPLVSAQEAGDEPVLLSELLPSVVVMVCSDRWSAGRFAQERFGSELVLLDDGYQHRRLARDLDLLLVD